MDYSIVIPARYHSQRLPAKPLLDIAGKTMIQRVYEQALQTKAKQVIVATDDQRIVDCVRNFGGDVCLTDINHKSGTERLAEVIDKYQWSSQHIVVNVQGDEPLIPPMIIEQVAKNLSFYATYDQLTPQDNALVPMATLAVPIMTHHELFNPNVVKVVRDKNNHALYFSRATIPFYRERWLEADQRSDYIMTDEQVQQLELFRHIGLYAYRAGFIKQYLQMEESPLEKIESLEQLRVLWHGYKIHIDIATQTPEIGVDTQEDLDKVRAIIAKNVKKNSNLLDK